jgi:PKD repeat protein
VNPNPVADFTATTACHTYPNFFTDNSTGAVLWTWDFGDASPVDNTITQIIFIQILEPIL